ncbi:hypothetical protein OS493_012614 [Desmophyllum pertusum]|uniref:Uncharacterized protein n=1 Tax=Desmophyllum pertusum TaxID=174260 RepID=A0A9W9ZDV6_9CNID|nr:hypothetical protein OS493_012614 [Desmophyllum pertusum]
MHFGNKGACENQEDGILLAESAAASDSEKKEEEETLLETIKRANFEEIEIKLTPRAFSKCDSNTLLLSMKVCSFKLRRLADSKGPDEGRFNQLANSVEKFTYCLLDPLSSDQEEREQFGEHFLDDIVDDAIDLDQKKVPKSI